METFHILVHNAENRMSAEGKKSMDTEQVKTAELDVKRKVKRGKPYGGKRQALTKDELNRLFAALKRNRHGHRDYMVALVAFLHGLRVSELIDLRWDDVDFNQSTIAIRR